MTFLKNKLLGAGLTTGVLMLPFSAHAALPSELTTEIADIKTNATELFAMFWPVILLVSGGFLVMSLVKRFFRKI